MIIVNSSDNSNNSDNCSYHSNSISAAPPRRGRGKGAKIKSLITWNGRGKRGERPSILECVIVYYSIA